MGRDKRIADSRAKEILDKSKTAKESRPTAETNAAEDASTPATPRATMGTGRALVQIALLYLIPIIVVILIGKLIFKL